MESRIEEDTLNKSEAKKQMLPQEADQQKVYKGTELISAKYKASRLLQG